MKPLSSRARSCPLCSQSMKKNGKNSSGTQRWYCPKCRYSTTSKQGRQARHQQFREFFNYITDTAPKRYVSTSICT
ncbi:IS1/IS1595 family N-terminal zinc-binding domain-containing protein [Trueperella pyogenes]|uniref:IS1/IS1595 family N-terminal zinc-binding domain-containing protein n=1 Tax=Trueperella pyogenes TaxID=1661 RepID=UPI003DA849EF